MLFKTFQRHQLPSRLSLKRSPDVCGDVAVALVVAPGHEDVAAPDVDLAADARVESLGPQGVSLADHLRLAGAEPVGGHVES